MIWIREYSRYFINGSCFPVWVWKALELELVGTQERESRAWPNMREKAPIATALDHRTLVSHTQIVHF